MKCLHVNAIKANWFPFQNLEHIQRLQMGCSYVARKPPSTGIVIPLTRAEPGPKRKRIHWTTSSTSANLEQSWNVARYWYGVKRSPAQGNLGKHRASFSRVGPAHLWFAHSTLVGQILSDYQTKCFAFCSPSPSRSWWQLGWLHSLGLDGGQTQELPPWEFAQAHILTLSTHLVTMSRAPLVAQ